jgi:AcrR family transcriptional regulator
LADIVAAAISIADEEGIDALSMRHVAARLACGVMSLYRHVKDREELIALALDAVFGEEPFPDPAPDDWRGRMSESARRQWRAYLRHPWIAPLISLHRPRLGPNGMREMEWAFGGLQHLAVPNVTRLQLYMAVTAFAHGAAGQAAAEKRLQLSSGRDSRAWWEAQAALLRELFSTGRYPLIARLGPGDEVAPDTWFEFGLTCLLDGFEQKLRTGAG